MVDIKPNKDSKPIPIPTKKVKMEFTDLTIDMGGDKNAESDTDSANEIIAPNEEKLNILRVQVLFWIFLERFVEMVIVIPVTLLAIKWEPLTQIVEEAFWPLEIFVLVSAFTMKALYRIPALTRLPGCFILKFHYLLFLIAVYFVLAIHFPRLFFSPNLSPYFAIMAAGTAGASYIYLSLISILGKVNARFASLYQSGMVMPLYALVVSQLVYYFAYNDGTYKVFMLNVVGGILIGFFLTLENIYLSKKFVNSKKLEEIAKKAGVISLSASGSMASLIYRQPCDEEKEVKRRDVGNV